MARKSTESLERERIAEAIARDLPPDAGGYALSSATAIPLKRALRGVWAVVAHEVDGEPYIERIATRSLKGAELGDIRYSAQYEFKEALCLKRVDIEGVATLEDGDIRYDFCQRQALSWDLEGPERLRVRPEMGYQYSSLNGEPAAVRDMETTGDDLVILFRIEAGELVLTEGNDVKRLRRLV